MQTGTIARKMDKGFGFISIEGQDKDTFFHSNGCVTPFDDLQEGETVQFNIEQGEKGPSAVDVERTA